MVSQPRPKFTDSPYFVPEPGNWHLRPGAPEETQREFDEFMKALGINEEIIKHIKQKKHGSVEFEQPQALKGIKIDVITAYSIVAKLKKRYIGSKSSAGKLIWNLTDKRPRLLEFEQAKKIKKLNSQEVYFYDERSDELYRTTYKNVMSYIDGLEPWEQTDAYVFDASLDWLIAITHEDNLTLVWNL